MKTKKKNYGYSIWKTIRTIWCIGIFVVVLLSLPSSSPWIQFVLNLWEQNIHYAPNTRRDYLFENEEWQQIYQGEILTTQQNISSLEDNQESPLPTTTPTTIFTWTLPQTPNFTWENFTWEIVPQNTNTWTKDILLTKDTSTTTTGTIQTWTAPCRTPRDTRIAHKDFVLAYEQRTDVPNICNVEKRVCINGMLGGKYTQASCKENVTYIYKKAEVVSYNQKVLNEYIQPTEPKYQDAVVTTQGKRNESETPAKTTRWTSNNPVINTNETNQQTTPKKQWCTTPRGQRIDHGQFIKAYKSPRGFIDLPCEVQLRACTDGILRGTFRYNTCTFTNTTYAEYLTSSSTQWTGKVLFFERIKKLFK